ncbi:MAG: plasmid pRiA4b ORF-3 family protein [Pseudonocardiales bacterium]|nr:plasmid pRiA4b ORF-3 family protein [Pseudonocardiales bacterium]
MIWRQLEVPAALSLAHLHEVLQASFAWSGEHLYRFIVHGREFGSGQLWLADPSTVRLADLGLRHRERFTYAYGFFSRLGCWRHDLRVEAITGPRPRWRYPWCSGGARTAPPEDCGGPEAFLALRQEHGLWATTMRMAELTTLLLQAPPTSTVREVLGEAIEELPGLR